MRNFNIKFGKTVQLELMMKWYVFGGQRSEVTFIVPSPSSNPVTSYVYFCNISKKPRRNFITSVTNKLWLI